MLELNDTIKLPGGDFATIRYWSQSDPQHLALVKVTTAVRNSHRKKGQLYLARVART
jgi:hypothetical protein